MLGKLLICSLVYVIYCYNLDLDHPVIVENPDFYQKDAYFGYSLVLFRDKNSDESWIKIGAPKATYNRSTASVPHSGVVYHCSFMETCDVDERLNYTSSMASSWTGGAMDISYKYKTLIVSNSRLQNLGKENPYIRGAVTIENLEKNTLYGNYNPLESPMEVRYGVYNPFESPIHYYRLPYYGRALVGSSVHFVQDENEVLIGAPGVFNFLGTIFRVKNIDKDIKYWQYDVIEPHGNYYEYSGYAVTSGYFCKRNELYYVTGLPKGFDESSLKNVPFGSVLIFTFPQYKMKFENQVSFKLKSEIYGTQFGEYFGSSLAAGDLNGDGLDDLIVGSPFRSNDDSGFNHGSVYVFYGNEKKLQYDPKNRIDGADSGGQFGSALMVLGDLDNDGFRELAVSAPREDSTGAVYIYTFDNVMKTLKISQKIMGKDIHPDLRGFGASFSRAIDIDDNGFQDFAVGSPWSGHAVILRSKPTVSLYASIRAPSTISMSSTSFSFRCCYFFTGYRNSNLTIIRNVTVDRDFNRFYFNNHVARMNSEEKSIDIKQNREQCEDVSLTKVGYHNYDDPITITLTYIIPEDPLVTRKNPVVITRHNVTSTDTFCKNCPLLSRKTRIVETKLVLWDHNCDHNGLKEPCMSKLEVSARFVNLREENTFVLGSKELLGMEITVTNKGDPAFSPVLLIALPNGVSMRMGPLVDCQISDSNTIRCEADVLNDKTSYNLKLSINPEETNELKFFLNASTITENTDDKSTAELTLKLKREADFLITGYSKDSSYIYEKGTPVIIQNVFKIEKFGPSPTLPVEVGVVIPYKMKAMDGTTTEFAKIIEQNDTSLENPLVKCENITDYKGRSKREEKQTQVDLAKMFNINCSTSDCVILKCLVGPFEGIQIHAEFSVNMEVDFGKLEAVMGKDWLENIDQIVIQTDAYVYADNFTQTGNRPDSVQLSNVVSIYKDLRISLWIPIVSAIIGLIILICVSIALAKAGFFERKEHKMLLQLKEEALEEEKLIEEMIQKELETGGPLEGDPILRYLNPKDLEAYWKRLEEESLNPASPLIDEDSKEQIQSEKNSS